MLIANCPLQSASCQLFKTSPMLLIPDATAWGLALLSLTSYHLSISRKIEVFLNDTRDLMQFKGLEHVFTGARL
jgi:hypothetical protein